VTKYGCRVSKSKRATSGVAGSNTLESAKFPREDMR